MLNAAEGDESTKAEKHDDGAAAPSSCPVGSKNATGYGSTQIEVSTIISISVCFVSERPTVIQDQSLGSLLHFIFCHKWLVVLRMITHLAELSMYLTVIGSFPGFQVHTAFS